jgi:hypothetical protein
MSDVSRSEMRKHPFPLQGGGMGWGSTAYSERRDDPLPTLRVDLPLLGEGAIGKHRIL